ncbi:hypothetical protein IIA16_04365 [bacterium]|nr:hypothetical protein [bacterium]
MTIEGEAALQPPPQVLEMPQPAAMRGEPVKIGLLILPRHALESYRGQWGRGFADGKTRVYVALQEQDLAATAGQESSQKGAGEAGSNNHNLALHAA